MIPLLISLLIAVLVIALLIWVVNLVIPVPWRTPAAILIVLIVLLSFAQYHGWLLR